MRWTSLQKDPSKAIKNEYLNGQQWSLLNNMPEDHIKKVVTDKVLRMDKNTCQSILEKMLTEKKNEEMKKDI